MVYRSLRDGVALRVQSREALLELADTVDQRDPFTIEHSRRVGELARLTAQQLRLPFETVEQIELAGRVHDVGKIGLHSALFAKTGALSDSEWLEIHAHPEVGARIMSRFPDFAAGTAMVLAHHERFDGTGYPQRLPGDACPIGARVLAVADAWDAMRSDRAHRPALEPDRAYAELELGRGTQFDPLVLDSFLQVLTSHPEFLLFDSSMTQPAAGGEPLRSSPRRFSA